MSKKDENNKLVSSKKSTVAVTNKQSKATKSAKTTKSNNVAKTSATTKPKKTASATKSAKATKSSKTTKSTTSKKATKTTNNKEVASDIIEYYDLPNKYDITTVRVLFQTPKKLFVYWEISEADRKNFLANNGNDFFETTSPFLIVKNRTKNYSFEIEINDFANSWYFDIPDSNCDYEVELIRKNKQFRTIIPITSSNNVEVPNNRILFEQNRKEIFFKNVKTNNITSKSVVNLQFIHHLGNFYPVNQTFYRKFYNEEDLYILDNPSSNL